MDLGHDLVDEARLLELERGEVDAQLERLQARQAMPLDDLPRRRLEDRPAEGEDRAVLLGHPDELGRIDRAARRVVPADQRLDADDPAAGEHDDRLVGDGQVAAADASAELRRQRVAFDDRAVHRRIEDLRPALAVRLGAVHRHVGVAQDLVDRGARPGRGDAGAAADDDLGAVDLERQLERGDDPMGDGQRLRDRRAADREQRELVAAEAGDHVARPELFGDPFGDGDEQLVAGGVTQRVVDDLEVIEVQERDDRRLVRRRQGHPQLDLVHERGPVGEARQGVVECLVPELLLETRQLVEGLLELAVLERDGGLVGDRLQQAKVVGLEAGAFPEAVDDRQCAEDAVLADQRTDHRLLDLRPTPSSTTDRGGR